MLEVLERFKFSPPAIYLISATAFALLHVNQRAITTFGAFAAGLILMAVYRKSGTLWVPIVAHYVVNLYFLGVGMPFVRMVETVG